MPGMEIVPVVHLLMECGDCGWNRDIAGVGDCTGL